MNDSDNKKRFESIYLSYFQAIHDFSNAYLRNDEMARDIAQNAFFALWNNFNPDYSEKEILSFLYTTARNQCLNHLKLLKMVEGKTRDIQETLYSESYFLNEVIRNENYRIVYDAIDKLPDRMRQIALLALDGLSSREIAEELSISLNTVKTLKKIAYSKLREMVVDQLAILLLLKIFI